jgi:DNA replication protein DnaC
VICKALHITGKSYIAQALANKAMTQGESTLYLRIPRLMQLLSSVVPKLEELTEQ